MPARAATSGRNETTARPSTPSTIGRFVGALTVESRPPGARVFIDGTYIGTPICLAVAVTELLAASIWAHARFAARPAVARAAATKIVPGRDMRFI